VGAYSVDKRDKTVPLDLPRSSVGAPIPLVLADEGIACVAYWAAEGELDNPSPFAIVRFTRVSALFLGPPNDEAFNGHPLANRGLASYRSFEVLNSSWIRSHERMNRVHWQHDPRSFASRRHFVLAFHDSIFECVARSVQARMVLDGSPRLRELEAELSAATPRD
jgi:hypothetical protein